MNNKEIETFVRLKYNLVTADKNTWDAWKTYPSSVVENTTRRYQSLIILTDYTVQTVKFNFEIYLQILIDELYQYEQQRT